MVPVAVQVFIAVAHAVSVEKDGIQHTNFVVCTEIGVGPLLPLQVDSGRVVVSCMKDHAGYGRADVGLECEVAAPVRLDLSGAVEEQRHMMVGERHVVKALVGGTMVGNKDKQRIGEP